MERIRIGGIELENARKGRVSIGYSNSRIKKSIKECLEDFSYDDVASGSTDDVSITLNNRDCRFMDTQMPKKGDRITPVIYLHNWTKSGVTKSIKCGRMVLDDLSFSGVPSTCTIGAVSMPAKGEFKNTKRTKTYKNVTVKEIARKIANRAGIALHYSAGHIVIKEIEQSKTSDSEFLLSICNEYGLGIKIYNGKIVIFNEEEYERKRPVATIERAKRNVISWSWNTTLQRTYTGAKVTFTDSGTNKKHHVTIGKAGRMLNVDVSAFSKRDAQLKAKAKLAGENKKRTTMTVTIFPDPRIIATSTIRMKGFRKLSGKYYVDKVSHKLNRSGGYVMTLEMHKVYNRIGF